MNILVTGAKGQLGNCLRNVAVKSDNHYIFTDVAELDITDAESVAKMVADNKINIIINCAAFTDVEKAEDNYELAEKLNAEAVRNLARAIKQSDGTLIHISTDYVFGGSTGNTPRSESEPVNPTGVYGLTKLHGEEAVTEIGCKALIFRTAWLYSEYGKNFVKTMRNLTATKPQLKVVFDQVGTPTYAQDLADAIFGIVEQGKVKGNEGIYHYSNEGVCSWYDFAKAIAQMSGNDTCDIQPCHSDEFPSKVIRPSYSVLDKTKIKNTFGLRIPHWTESLKKCVAKLTADEA
ncbi:MAG: dTDP-4-dehydrorhamnose reductase [Bacteroidales bacterium]|nr:dTDP-4-dehydrorhamnose reductase [Bacteroidales bacterium]